MASKPVVLHVLHAWGGGTDKHVNDLSKLLDNDATSLIISPTNDAKVCIRSYDLSLGINFVISATDSSAIVDVLRKLNVGLIHVHQLIGHAVDFREISEELNIPYYVTLHDYTLICPQIHLIKQSRYCGEPDVAGCNECLATSNMFSATNIQAWRESYSEVVSGATTVITPTQDVATRFKKYIPSGNYKVVPHENIVAPEEFTIPPLSENELLRVVMLGSLNAIKGGYMISAITNYARAIKAKIEFTLIGQTVGFSLPTDEYFKQTGKYDNADIETLIAEHNPHVILFSSVVPETYSYTLSSAIKAGRAVIAPKLGSFTERLSGREWSWQYSPRLSADQLVQLLIDMRSNFITHASPAVTGIKNTIITDFYTNDYLKIIENRPVETNIVLITSALHTNYGVYNTAERIHQTLDTVDSVRKYIPNSVIILLDASTTTIQTDESPEFNKLIDNVDYYFDYSDDTDFQHFHNNVTNYDIGKNAMESLAMLKTLQHINADAELMGVVAKSARIFKLSGRYLVTDKFDIDKFNSDATKDKYVFRQRAPSWVAESDTGVNHQLYTRLWSFTPSLFLPTINMYRTLIQNMFSTFSQGKYIDIEHSMAKFIPKDALVELDVVGVKGNIAPNGAEVID